VRFSHKTVALVVAGGVLLSGGMAFASGAFDASSTSREIIGSAAEDLGVTPAELSDALRSAAAEQVNAALAAGDISEEHARALQRVIEAGHLPFPGPLGGHVGPLASQARSARSSGPRPTTWASRRRSSVHAS
jgi:hypothetical protein